MNTMTTQSSIGNTLIKLDPGATIPTRAHDTDVGYDITALKVDVENIDGAFFTIADETTVSLLSEKIYKIHIDTGVHLTPPPGYYFELVPNSRIAKTDFIYANSFGVIDPAYTGSIKVVLNTMDGCFPEDLLNFLPGKVVGQLILRPHLSTTFTQVNALPETTRADGGFGSTANQ